MPHIVNPFVMWILIVLGGAAIFFGFDAVMILPRTDLSHVFFAISLFYWFFFIISALRENASVVRSVAGVQSLVKTGIYARVRHPIYSADIFLMWGIYFMIPTFPMLLTVFWFILVVILWTRLEEECLAKRFKVAYKSYRVQVPMMIPQIWRTKKVWVSRKKKAKVKTKKIVENSTDAESKM